MIKNFRKRTVKRYHKLKQTLIQSPLQLYVLLMTTHASTLVSRYFK